MLRVGTVPYLVARPLDEGLERESGFRVTRAVPADLVRALRARELDVALVSSIELFRQPGYRFLDGLAVAGAGHVGSVQVFLRAPIERVASVALDPASRTAAALVRVLFERRIGGDAGLPRGSVRWIEAQDGADPCEIEADAWLRIGDPALREHLASDSAPVFNPAAAWTARTGLPFVFALWIARPGVELTPDQVEAFARARSRGASRIAELAQDAARAWDLPEAACRRYLAEECVYEPRSGLHASLLRFRDEAAALGLARADLAPDAIATAPVGR